MDIDRSLKDLGVSNNDKLVFLENTLDKNSWNLLQFHYHEVYEILICFEASEVNCFAQNRVFEMKRGSVFIFSPYTLHRTSTAEGSCYRRAIIYFNAADLAEFSRYSDMILSFFAVPYQHIELNDEELRDVTDILNGKNEYDGSGFMQEVKNRLKLFRLTLYLCEKLRADRNAAISYSRYGDLNKILDYIQKNLSDPSLTLASIAQEFFRSTTSVNNLFKKNIGSTIKEYIILKRVDKAQELLRDGATVTEACEGSGFNNYSHFIRTFSKVTGLSPKQYVKSTKNE